MQDRVYYVPVGEQQKADWDAFRKDYIAHFEKARELSKEIGAQTFRIGFGGSLVAVSFKKDVHHAAFSKPRRDGTSVILSRGRSEAQKAAIAWMDERNEELRKAFPRPFPVAEKHGFISQIEYTHKGGTGSQSTARFFEAVEPTWFNFDSVIVLVTGDVQGQIDTLKSSEYYEDIVVTPDRFEAPEGYERITAAKYNFLKAEYELQKEERKN